jgi:hypothetical protein
METDGKEDDSEHGLHPLNEIEMKAGVMWLQISNINCLNISSINQMKTMK